jgi:hypothetical protein
MYRLHLTSALQLTTWIMLLNEPCFFRLNADRSPGRLSAALNAFLLWRYMMNKHLSSLRLLGFVVVALWLPGVSSAQEQQKSHDSPQETLDRLHPKATEQPAPHRIKILAGYKHKGATDFEGNNTGKIWKKGGLKIIYAIGFSWGQEVDPKDKDTYLQYSEKVVNGWVVRLALTRKKMFMVSVALGDMPNTLHAANFSTKVEKPEDAADMVTMALSLIQ